jgi:hypothetical protein
MKNKKEGIEEANHFNFLVIRTDKGEKEEGRGGGSGLINMADHLYLQG